MPKTTTASPTADPLDLLLRLAKRMPASAEKDWLVKLLTDGAATPQFPKRKLTRRQRRHQL